MPLVSVHLRKSKKNIIAFLETSTTITKTAAAVVGVVTETNVNKVILEKHSIRKSSKKRQFFFFYTDVNQEKKKKKKKSLNDHIQKKLYSN